MTIEERAYIAGLFDGEGSCSFVYRKASKNGKRYGRLEAKITNCDKPVLDWVAQSFGSGGVYLGGHVGVVGRRQAYNFMVSNEQARKFLRAILPYLLVKRTRAEELLELDSITVKRRIKEVPAA